MPRTGHAKRRQRKPGRNNATHTENTIMIATLTLAVMAGATLAATPCEGLKTISWPTTTVTTSEFIPEGPQQLPARGGGGAAAPRGDGAGRGQAPGAPQGGAPAAAGARGDGGARGGGGGRGGGQPQILPAHCRVVAVLKPTPD